MKEEYKTVSLLMLGYNSLRYVKQAIDSVRHQTYPYWELVFVDDCSTDGTWELASKLAESDPRIKVYKNEVNLGIVKNRKKAYEYSTGYFVGHLDNDDILERWALEEMVWAFKYDKEAMLIYSDCAQIGVEGEHQIYSANPNFDRAKLAEFGWRHLSLFKREVMEHIDGYNDKLISACEDGDLFMQIAEKFPVARLPKILYYHRAHPNNSIQFNKQCNTCTERPVCNFIRVWAKAANVDPVNLKPNISVDESIEIL